MSKQVRPGGFLSHRTVTAGDSFWKAAPLINEEHLIYHVCLTHCNQRIAVLEEAQSSYKGIRTDHVSLCRRGGWCLLTASFICFSRQGLSCVIGHPKILRQETAKANRVCTHQCRLRSTHTATAELTAEGQRVSVYMWQKEFWKPQVIVSRPKDEKGKFLSLLQSPHLGWLLPTAGNRLDFSSYGKEIKREGKGAAVMEIQLGLWV